MQRNKFLPEILVTLFDRHRGMRTDDDPRDIYELCNALIAQEGQVSGIKIAEVILARYRAFNEDAKLKFFQFMNESLDIDPDRLAACARSYAKSGTWEDYKDVYESSVTKRLQFLRRLNQPSGATADLVSMRVDLLRLTKVDPDLRRADLDFSRLLRSWFNHGFLVLKQIDWSAPASLLDKIVAYEAVHEINDLDDLRRRLTPPDRRCFAFFHPAPPDEPLIFVEVALSDQIPGSIDDLLSERRDPITPEQATAAVFYSISNCQKGLAGISFGNLLIKQVAKHLLLEIPHLSHFVTLSPIPRLKAWLERLKEDSDLGHIATAVLDGTASDADMRIITARYLLGAKRKDGTPFDPVTRFHLGNGAEVFDVHANADSSLNGRAQSAGAMVNYLYDLKQVESNHEDFALRGTIKASKAVASLTKSALTAKPEESAKVT